MPFKSEKQRRLLWAKHPEIAQRWAHEYPESNKNLPMYANKKENSPEDNKDGGKEAQLALSRTLLQPILAHYSQETAPGMAKRSESILAHVEMPETNVPSYAGEKHVRVSGDVVGDDAGNMQEHILCSKGTQGSKQAEVNKIAEILRKKAMVPSYNIRQMLQAIGIGGPNNDVGRTGPGTGAHGNGYGYGVGSGGGVAQGQGNMGSGLGIFGNAQAGARDSIPAPPKGSFLPKNVGSDYLRFLNTANNSISQARMARVIPPPMGSTPPPVVATYPGMNSAPQKTASNVAGSSLNNGIQPLTPIQSHFQGSNVVAKGQSQFAKGNDAIINVIGKLSPFKTVGGKVDPAAGMTGGAYGNLPNTPKTQALG